MALQKQLISVPFAEGLDTKTHSQKTPQGKLTTAENVVFNKGGALSRRTGHRVLNTRIEGGTTDIEAADGLAVYNDELLLFTGTRCYAYAEGTARWIDRGLSVCISTGERDVLRNTYEQTNPDSALHRGLHVVAWEDSRGGVRYSVTDEETGVVIVNDALVASVAVRPRVVVFRDEFVIFYGDSANLRYKRISTIQPTVLGSAVNPVTTMDTTRPHYDVHVVGERLFIVWNATGGSNPSITYIDSTWTGAGFTRTQAALLAGTTEALALFSDTDDNVWIALATSAGVEAMFYTYNLPTLPITHVHLESVPSERITGVASDGVCAVVYEPSGASHSTTHRVRQTTFVLEPDYLITIGAQDSVARSVGLVSDAFECNGLLCVLTAHESSQQSTYFLMTTSGSIIGRVAAGVAGGLRTKSTLANVVVEDGDVRTIATLRKSPLETESGRTFSRLGVAFTSFDFSALARFRTEMLGGSLLVAGGVMQMYDGSRLTEHGFHLYPEVVTAPAAVGSGGSLSLGTYQYCFTYERTDRTGRIHRSAPSVPVSVVTVASDSVTITFPTLRLTVASGVRLVIYRTEVDGTTFKRVSSLSSPTLNDTTADSVVVVDTAADTAIASNEFLYTTGDIVANVAPDACLSIATRSGRAYIAGFSDPNTVAFSKLSAEGEAASFAAEFRQQVDDAGGPITALATLDDVTLIFKRNAIFALTGDGPNDADEQSDFREPVMLTNDVGCTEPASVVRTPLGVFFKSAKGFYVVDRGRGVTYVGAPVEDWNSYEVSGAALVPDTNRVVFVTEGGPALVYDHFFQQWSTFTNHEAVGCAIWRGQFVFAKPDGSVYVADSTMHSDGDRRYRLRVVRAWWSFGGMTGQKRLYEFAVLGEYKGTHRLRVQFGYDFNENFSEEKTVDMGAELASTTYGSESPYGAEPVYGGEWPLYLIRFQQAQQICTSFRVAVEEVQTEDYNEALTLSELSCVVGVKPGVLKLRASRTLGTA